MAYHVGNLVWKLRNEKGISQADLSRGILRVMEYSRFERGRKELDKMHLEALFQRLGKSEDKLELAVGMEEYQLLAIHYEILNLLLAGKVRETDKKIEEYQTYADMERPLYKQIVLLFRALRDYIKNRDRKKVIFVLEKALEMTFPEWKDIELESVYLCTQEIQVLLLRIYFDTEKEKMHMILKDLFSYIDRRYTDGEGRVRVYPQCAWILGQVYLSEQNIGSAFEVCEKGLNCLIENGALSLMKELLELKAECLERIGKSEELQKIGNQKAAIDFLYKVAGKSYGKEKAILLLQTSRETEIIVLNEVIREMRQKKRLSQEQLSEGICSQETLSRIESGGRSPNRKNIYAMLQKMGFDRGSYYGSIVADDYALYEKVREYKCSMAKREQNNVKRLKRELEEQLNLKNPVNKQFMETCRIQENLSEKNSDHEWGIRELKRILGYTFKDFDGTIYRVPFREEVVILNQIAFSLRMLGRMDEALEIFEQILWRYQNSVVSNDFHAVSCFLIYVNYTGDLEVCGRLDRAEQIGKEGLEIALACQRGDISGKILANLSCIYEKLGTKKDTEMAENCLKYSYFLVSLYQNKYYEKVIYDTYQKKYSKCPD